MKIISLLISLFGIIKTKALKCVSVTNQECMARPKIIEVNKNEIVFYPLSIKVVVILTTLMILCQIYACQISLNI